MTKITVLQAQRTIGWSFGPSWHGVQCHLKKTEDKILSRLSSRPEKLSNADEQNIKVIFLRNRKNSKDLKQDLGPFSWSHQLFAEVSSEAVKAILKEGKRGEKTEICQITQGLNWKYVIAGLKELWIQILLKQCGINITGNGTKGRNIERRSLNLLREAWRTISESFTFHCNVRRVVTIL